MSHRYSDTFLNYTARSSSLSARRIVAVMRSATPITSVLDVGCARGTWLREWRDAGVADIQGIDGSYVDQASILIDGARFATADLAAGFALGRSFDLVQCLEVAEHLPNRASAGFVDCLVAHSRGLVLFSAAPPGQGGEHHVNEQPYEYWRELFRARGYHAIDWVRPKLSGDKEISFWYRYNIMLYASAAMIPSLPADVRASLLPDDEPIADVSPVLFRMRKQIVRRLPASATMALAQLKARLHA
jgi:SAM-dependent methyltransferase